jgi:squalene-associated FAD-dependent desaturase
MNGPRDLKHRAADSSFIPHPSSFPSVAVIGGGLAGLAAAVALAQQNYRVELFESRRQLGGRAGSFVDPASGETVDHCQHVGMGCCTNLIDFFERTGISGLLRRDRRLNFIGPDGAQYDFAASRWLPAPLHLAGAFWGLKYLKAAERLSIARALRRLAKDRGAQQTAGQWLREQGQSLQAIDRFWSVVLDSALGDTIDRVSIAAARKVFVDGFLVNCRAYEVIVPRVPLAELYQHVADWLGEHGVQIHLETPVQCVETNASRATAIVLADGARRKTDFVVAAVPWRRIGELLATRRWPAVDSATQIESSPITAAHLWFDRPMMALPHAVLVGRLSQWVFAKSEVGSRKQETDDSPLTAHDSHYYQVIISGSHNLAGRPREEIIQEILGDLQAAFPQVPAAQLVRWRIVTDPAAVFSMRPGIEALRPTQQTPLANVMLAGDWTATGWPATMEGAVRSGYLAAEAVLRAAGRPQTILVPELPRSPLARLVL